MITLFIDTSLDDVSIAVLDGTSVLGSIIRGIPNQHSVYTISYIDEVLQKCKLKPSDVDRVMVVVGPGSFTGIRIGVTVAKVYAYLENIEVIPISSLKMRGISCPHDYCLSIIDAHHGNYYIGLYDKDNKDVMDEMFVNKDRVLDVISKYNPLIVSDRDGVIDNIEYFKCELDFSKIVSFYDKIPSINPHLVNPNYLKLPQALEENHD